MADWFTLGAGALQGLGSLFGASTSAAGAAQINAQNIQMQQQTNAENWSHAVDTMTFNANEAFKNRVWQEEMANTAYQRATNDMRMAGLNPILAYQQGGAGIGSGAQGAGAQSVSQAPRATENPGGEMGRGIANMVNSAVDAAKTVQGIDLMKEQERNTRAQVTLTNQKENESVVSQQLMNQDMKNKQQQEQNLKDENANIRAQQHLIRANTGKALSDAYAANEWGYRQRKEADYPGTLGENFRFGESITRRGAGLLHDRGVTWGNGHPSGPGMVPSPKMYDPNGPYVHGY